MRRGLFITTRSCGVLCTKRYAQQEVPVTLAVMTYARYVVVSSVLLCAVVGSCAFAAQSTSSQTSGKKKDILDPQCKKEEQAEMKKCSQWTDKAKKTECEKAAKRDAFEVLVLKNTGEKVSDKTNLSKQAKEGHYCVQEQKIANRYGKKCGECKKGVAVISRKISQGITRNVCNDAEKDYRVVCREEQDVPTKNGNQKQSGATDGTQKTAKEDGSKADTPKQRSAFDPDKAVTASHYDCGGMKRAPVCYGGDGSKIEKNKLRDGDIAVPQSIVDAYNLKVGDPVRLRGPDGREVVTTYRDINEQPRIDFYRPTGVRESSAMQALGFTYGRGLMPVQIVGVRGDAVAPVIQTAELRR